jgi:cytochrome d ubiquinol oxidase subunit II
MASIWVWASCFPFAPSDQCRDRMMNSIAPFWDGNETWLVLGGGGLFAAFPLAYAILMPAFYIPIILMLLGLIFRGVAFEFRFKATGKSRRIWDYSFHFGSLTATFMQGVRTGHLRPWHRRGRPQFFRRTHWTG